MESDLAIAQRAKLKPIWEVAESIGIRRDELILYGDYKAKVKLSILERLKDRPNGRYIVVTAMTPTPLGEGKTVTTIGLAQGLAKIGKKAVCCLRQPSLGPVFGIKGGAAGGGYSQVVPMEDINLHLTGDMHAVTAAHSLLAAMTDTSLVKGNPAGLDPRKITLRRCVDMNEGVLRQIVIGLSDNYIPRQTGYDLTAASEVMAALTLSKSIHDLRQRLGRIVVGYRSDDTPVTAEDLKAAGAMTVLLKDAIMPNLLQTLEHVPAFIHGGPFANIAHGNNSILADMIALKCADFVVTEAGFGADMGMEKFFNIKCRASGLLPDAVCMVATVRAMKAHSGRFKIVPGKPLPPRLLEEDLEAVDEGWQNMAKHIENAHQFQVPCAVAINRFPTDSDEEIELIKVRALEAGAVNVAVSDAHTRGGEGAAQLAEIMVLATTSQENRFKMLYPDDWPVEKKIETICTKIYGAVGVDYSRKARKDLERIHRNGWDRFAVCMAKTQYSISHDPELYGRPKTFVVPIREIRIAAGAGFVVPLCDEIRTMPALGSHPAAQQIDIDEKGNIVGLF